VKKNYQTVTSRARRAKNATLCVDGFHVVKWATDAFDQVRRQVWNEARRGGRSIRNNRDGIDAALVHNLSNALVESTNTKIRVLHRMAFGFKKPEHLIALALLDRGGYCPPLPGRQAA